MSPLRSVKMFPCKDINVLTKGEQAGRLLYKSQRTGTGRMGRAARPCKIPGVLWTWDANRPKR